jgi:hypothetical protein
MCSKNKMPDYKQTGGFSTAMGAARDFAGGGGGTRKCAYKATVRIISVAAWSEKLNVFCRSNIDIIGVLARFLYVS